jgi:hypothetical protein
MRDVMANMRATTGLLHRTVVKVKNEGAWGNRGIVEKAVKDAKTIIEKMEAKLKV